MADEQATVRAIYELAGQPYDASVSAAMAAFAAEHPRGRHGEVRYDMAGLGLDGTEVERRLHDYRQRFVDG